MATTPAPDKTEGAEATPPAEPVEPEGLQRQIADDAVKKAQTSEQVRTDRIKQEVLVDYSQTITATSAGGVTVNAAKKLCWPACICTNSKCPGRDQNGQPRLFAYRYPAVTVGPDGKPDWSANSTAPPVLMMGVCPFCFKANTVQAYVPPEAVSQHRQLTLEIERKNKEIKKITDRGGTLTPEQYQEWIRLLDQRTSLPIYYLCE
ncbi:MAG: hypothetical protein K8T25_16715 [Planctomycetia bacterium]|nr:hypothetical protein [Planctomycetia bacterium]